MTKNARIALAVSAALATPAVVLAQDTTNLFTGSWLGIGAVVVVLFLLFRFFFRGND